MRRKSWAKEQFVTIEHEGSRFVGTREDKATGKKELNVVCGYVALGPSMYLGFENTTRWTYVIETHMEKDWEFFNPKNKAKNYD